MGLNAFIKTGNTIAFVAGITAPTPVQCVSTTLGGNQYRVINNGSVTAFLGYGQDAANASTNANVVSTTSPSFPLLPNTDEILTFVPNAYFTAVTSSGNATIFITPGDGL
jgi:hypothetical protein